MSATSSGSPTRRSGAPAAISASDSGVVRVNHVSLQLLDLGASGPGTRNEVPIKLYSKSRSLWNVNAAVFANSVYGVPVSVLVYRGRNGPALGWSSPIP